MISNEIIMNAEIQTTRTNYNKMLPTKRRVAHCAIDGCTNLCYPDDGSKRVAVSFQNSLTICKYHVRISNLIECYSTENNIHVGKNGVKGITQSIELETANNSITSVLELTHYKFMPSDDSSLDLEISNASDRVNKTIEWKSPIFHSYNSYTRLLGKIEAMLQQDLIKTNDSCGLHIHTGLCDDAIDFRYLFKDMDEYMRVFGDIYAYMDAMPNEKMHEHYGRGFINYARTCRKSDKSTDEYNMYYLPRHNGNGRKLSHYDTKYLKGDDNLVGTGSYNCTQHYLAFNFQHSYSMEFRLPKFTSAAKVHKVSCALQEVVMILRDEYYVNHNSRETSNLILNVWKNYFPY